MIQIFKQRLHGSFRGSVNARVVGCARSRTNPRRCSPHPPPHVPGFHKEISRRPRFEPSPPPPPPPPPPASSTRRFRGTTSPCASTDGGFLLVVCALPMPFRTGRSTHRTCRLRRLLLLIVVRASGTLSRLGGNIRGSLLVAGLSRTLPGPRLGVQTFAGSSSSSSS